MKNELIEKFSPLTQKLELDLPTILQGSEESMNEVTELCCKIEPNGNENKICKSIVKGLLLDIIQNIIIADNIILAKLEDNIKTIAYINKQRATMKEKDLRSKINTLQSKFNDKTLSHITQ